MKNEYELFGKDLKNEIGQGTEKKTVEEIAANMVETNYDKASRPIEGEIEKSPEEIKFIELANRYIKDELEELGVMKKLEIEPKQLHFFSHEDYIKKFPAQKDFGHHSSSTNAAFLDEGAHQNRLRFYKTILHEMIHIASIHKFYVEETEEGKVNVKTSYRTGYGVSDPRKRERNQPEYFRWFYEAVVDKTTLDIILKNDKKLRKELNITEKEVKESSGDFYPYLDDLNALIKKLAEKKGEDEETIWQRIKRGQFSGEMMHLRDVEKYLGKGELERLAHLGNKK